MDIAQIVTLALSAVAIITALVTAYRVRLEAEKITAETIKGAQDFVQKELTGALDRIEELQHKVDALEQEIEGLKNARSE